jgi:hypothetical protein
MHAKNGIINAWAILAQVVNSVAIAIAEAYRARP